jgi:hypothetical protein
MVILRLRTSLQRVFVRIHSRTQPIIRAYLYSIPCVWNNISYPSPNRQTTQSDRIPPSGQATESACIVFFLPVFPRVSCGIRSWGTSSTHPSIWFRLSPPLLCRHHSSPGMQLPARAWSPSPHAAPLSICIPTPSSRRGWRRSLICSCIFLVI